MSGLPYNRWRDTLETLHLWTQIVGKFQLAPAPPVNHWWHIAQRVTARGLTTGPLPHGERTFEIDLDFVEHVCRISVSDGGLARVPFSRWRSRISMTASWPSWIKEVCTWTSGDSPWR